MKEWEPNYKLGVIFIVAECVYCPLFFILSYLLYKVYVRYRLTDKPMLLSNFAVLITLGLLIIFCAFNLDDIFQEKSFWAKTNLRWNTLSSIGFFLEIFILLGLIFDLYKWWLFIVSTKVNDDQMSKISNLEFKILQLKIRTYYFFLSLTSIIVIIFVSFVTMFLYTSVPVNTPDDDPKVLVNIAWAGAVRDFTNICYITFLVGYIFSLTILRHRLKTYFPYEYK
jgi:hypothetical protein